MTTSYSSPYDTFDRQTRVEFCKVSSLTMLHLARLANGGYVAAGEDYGVVVRTTNGHNGSRTNILATVVDFTHRPRPFVFDFIRWPSGVNDLLDNTGARVPVEFENAPLIEQATQSMRGLRTALRLRNSLR